MSESKQQAQASQAADHDLPADLIVATAADGAQVKVALHGGHLCSWRTADGAEHLFLSALNTWRSDAAIRGGMPVIFPQFAGEGALPKHGFARVREWTLLESSVLADGAGMLRLGLSDDAETRKLFPHAFALELRLSFGGRTLHAELSVTNRGDQPFQFTCALHTYLQAQVAQSAILGLQGHQYRDALDQRRIKVVDEAELRISAEIDRVYFQVDQPLTLQQPGHAIVVAQGGFADAVVWNPWVGGSAAIADLPADGYQHFVCIEAAAVARPVALAAGDSWLGFQQLTVTGPV
ncbi:D-hexose-6-phosphate mutarotase [Paraherbaspirillum soli]|uniref:Putative glucose-6-phosphate 1-epimerase n=1 Tax=Paraherbaspirillum soli TaxID=631222 RepID=A0ABW0M5C1_9BURK